MKKQYLRVLRIAILAVCLASVVSCSSYPGNAVETEVSESISAVPKTSTPAATETAAPPDVTPSAVPQRDLEGTKRVWMNVFYPSDLVDTGKWKYVSENIDTVSVYLDYLNETDMDSLREFSEMLNRTGIKLCVECGGITDRFVDNYAQGTDILGKKSAGYELACLERLKRAGKTVDYISFDHPVTRAMYPFEDYKKPARMTTEEAAEQLAYAMSCWKKVYPGIKFLYCVNFPNHGWKGEPAYYSLVDEYGRGDFYEELEAVTKAAEKAGVEFYAVLADDPYDYVTGKMRSPQQRVVDRTDWMARLCDLEKDVKVRGMKFALFFNSETPGRDGPEGEYYRQTLSYISEYTASGGEPDIYFIESWYAYPRKAVPESEKYSVTYITADVIRLVKFGLKADLANIDMGYKAPEKENAIAHNWDFDGKVEGWIDYSCIDDIRSEGGSLYIRCSGNDPYILSPDKLNIDSGAYKTLHIRIRNGTNSRSVRVFFITNADPVFNEAKSYNIPVAANMGDFTDLYIELSRNSLWTGTVRRLRIDPADSAGKVYIDLIAFE